MRTRRAAAVGIMLLCLGALAPAGAIDLPPLPPQTQPVLDLLAPTVSPVCGNAALVVVLAPSLASGVAIPPDVLSLLGPVLEVCGAVPSQKGGYNCALDAAGQALLGQLEAQAIGAPLPVAAQPENMAVGQVAAIENQLTPGTPLHLTPTVVGTLQCKPTTSTEAPTPTPPPPAPSPAPAVEPETPTPGDLSALALPAPSVPIAPAVPETPVTEAPTTVPPTPLPTQSAAPAVAVDSGFRYPEILLFPLVLLVLLGFLAAAFTRPVRAAATRRRS